MSFLRFARRCVPFADSLVGQGASALGLGRAAESSGMDRNHEKNADEEIGENVNEIQALAEAVLAAASAAGRGVTVSFEESEALRIIYANEAAARISGYSVEELLGMPTAALFVPSEKERIERTAAGWRRDGVEPERVETVIVRKGGDSLHVEMGFSVVPLSGQSAVVTFVQDISERRSAVDALRRSERRFRRLIEAAPDAIGVCRDGRFVYLNPALSELFGRPSGSLVDRELVEFVHPDDRESVWLQGKFDLDAEQPESRTLRYRLVLPDLRVVMVETLSLPIEYEGRPAVLGFTRDTTERQREQAQLAVTDRIATLEMLAASVAHEINNPLAYANLNLEVLARHVEQSAPQVEREALAPVISAARDGLANVARIVRDLQSLTAPQVEERWPVEVSEVLESAVNVAMHTIRGRARIERDYRDVPPLKTDPTRMGQILLNLLSNAVQSFGTPDETKNVIRLSISSTVRDVVIVVSDNGMGMAKEKLLRIFEPFFTTKAEGMGLGLAISRVLATSLGGTLAVDSAEGQGTTFSLSLSVPRFDKVTCQSLATEHRS